MLGQPLHASSNILSRRERLPTRESPHQRRSPKDGAVNVVQTRPETFWSKMKGPGGETDSHIVHRVAVVHGLAASPGLHAGRAKIVPTTAEAGRLMKNKDILVTRMTNPDWVPYMKIAGAIVTEDGGTTCHAAIVS